MSVSSVKEAVKTLMYVGKLFIFLRFYQIMECTAFIIMTIFIIDLIHFERNISCSEGHGIWPGTHAVFLIQLFRDTERYIFES